ncbi:putative ribonuclease H-like domain-containing protein [Tanacetum coccineum]
MDCRSTFFSKSKEFSRKDNDDGSKPLSDDGKNVDEDSRKDSECNDQEKKDNVNSTNNVNAASINEVNVVDAKTSIELPLDPNMPELEDYSIFEDESPQTRRISKNLEAHGFVGIIQQRTNHKDLQNYLFACFLSQEEPKKDLKIQTFLIEYTRLKKALYGLHQALRAWYETVSTYLLDNEFQRRKIDKTLFIKRYKGDILLVQVYVDDIIFGLTKNELCNAFEKFTKVKTTSTPIETQKPLLKDEDCEEVDVHMYRYHVNPKVSHLHAVKRIFRYLKGQPKLGLWYLKDSPFDLVAYTNSDYARASLDRKSTIGGCQFLGCRLISWQCKKQTVVANSITKAKYVATSSCCGQVH